MSGSFDETLQDSRNNLIRAFKAVAAILVALVLLSSLTACERPGRPYASHEDYVGIWALYESHADGKTESVELGKGINEFLVINDNGTAVLVMTMDGEKPTSIDCSWHRTAENKREGIDSGIVLVADELGFENPFTYYYATEELMKPHFIDKRLVKGNLAADYGYRTDYFEKVSNDVSDAPSWLPTTTMRVAPSVNDSTMPEGAISWVDAPSHVGKTVSVYGPVVGAEYASESNEQPTFINIGAPYPDERRLTMVVWGEDRSNFPGDPESIYLGKTVCVTGELYAYDNATYVKVTTPDQVTALD